MHPPSGDTASTTSSSATKSIQAKPAASKSPKTETSAGKSSSTNKSSSSPAPKTFRFEGSISSETYKTTKSFDLAGVNILNRKPLDTRTALDKLQRRRETHNRVERKRRDCINQLVDDLTRLLPSKHLEEVTSKCHRVNVLRGAVAHIKFLTEQNSVLAKSVDAAKAKGFNISMELASTEEGSETADPSTSTEGEGMAMDVDAESVKHENMEDDNEDDQLARTEKTSSRSSSPSVDSTSSRSASPRLTPSKALGLPPVIVTDSPNPSSEKESTQSQSKEALVPPPISVITEPSDTNTSESHHRRNHSRGSLSTSPMLPPAQYMTSPKSSPSAFPPSPVSPLPSLNPNPFSASTNQPDNHQGSSKDQQLSPFMQRRTSSSPSLPPISSLANLQLQSPSGDMDHQTSPLSRPADGSPSSDPSSPSSPDGKFAHQRTVLSLPPLKIPPQNHLHPSYQAGHDSSKSGHRNSLTSTSPRSHQRTPDEHQAPPFMLSPMSSRSPATTPHTPNPPSHYPQWGHERSDAHPPPPHPGHYMPGPPPHAPHGYPHGYPYPYPYHPSYAYPHPHGPPPPHHPHHQPPVHTLPQPSSAPSAPARPPQPEPIFIQEEPWNVQKKRTTSNGNSKSQSSSSSKQVSKKSQDKEVDQLADDTAPLSPTLSITSSASGSNHRKRPSRSGADDLAEAKRAKQQPMLGADLESRQEDQSRGKEGSRQQRDSGVVMMVMEAGKETAAAGKVLKEAREDADAAQALTSLAQNA
ncbi:hypothetical protein BGX34_009163 [Mortierella sp. NVP85]|nr:hypothetical protein BGX34_009163 [Mortierella sp. NVP85]